MPSGSHVVVRGAAETPPGRETELKAIHLIFERAADGTYGLLLTGEAGIGKTAVLEAALSSTRELGFRVLVSRPTAAESTLSFAGLGDLLDGVAGELVPRLPSPQGRALAVALGLEEATPLAPPRPSLIGRAVLGVLRELASGGPLLVVVDDLPWLDAPSADALLFALRRLGREPVGFIATARTGSPGAAATDFERSLTDRIERMELGPLSLGAVQRLLRERFAATVSRPRVRRIYERSGGNPFYALELARAFLSGGDERLPPDLRHLVAARIERLPPATRLLLVALAASARPTTALARALGGESALEIAERDGVVVVDREAVRFAHPLLAAATLDGATATERRGAHQQLARLVDDPEERARHLALARDEPDEDTARLVEQASAAALARAAPLAAAELAEAAVRLTPPGGLAYWRRGLDAARRNRTVGDTGRQRELLSGVLAACNDPALRAEARWQLAVLAGDEGDGPAARRLIGEARAEADGDALAAAICLDAVWLEGGIGGEVAPAEAALEHAARAGDPILEAEALSAVAYASFTHGRGLRRDYFERAVSLERSDSFIEASRRPTTRYGLVAKWAGDLALSRRLLESVAAKASEEEDATATVVLYYLAWLHLIAGEWARGLERAEEACELAMDAGRLGDAAAALVTHAIIDAHLGRLDDARGRLDETRRLAGDTEAGLGDAYAVLWAWASALVELADGQPDRAASELESVISRLRDRGLDEPGYHPWVPTCVEALIRAGRVADAEELVRWFGGNARRLGRAWALAMSAHMAGSIAAARGDIEAALAHFEQALELHVGTHRPFDRAWTLLLHGETLRRSKQRRRARAALTEALDEFHRLGAALWAARARDQLGRITGRAPAGDLTPAETRVAVLVAAGKSNKEVAADLYVSVRTVETTLSRIYRKLGLHSRGELTVWFLRR